MVRNKQNTPGIIKYPFWEMTRQNPDAVYACVNLGAAFAPKEIAGRSVCIDGDIEEVLKSISKYFLRMCPCLERYILFAVSYSILFILTIFVDKNG